MTLVPIIGRGKIFSLLLVLLMFESSALAQTGDWQAVRSLQPGVKLLVKAQHRYLCYLEGAMEDELICRVHAPRSFRLVSVSIPRSEIQEVRKLPNPNQAKDAWIGAGIGAGAGAISAGTGSKSAPGANAFFGALAGAGLGALVGATVPILQVVFFRHGKLVYRR